MGKEVSIFWFRRDLRLDDNAGLKAALQGDFPVLPIFIFDPEILDSLPEDDARVSFIFERLQSMRNTLQEEHGSSVAMYHGTPEKIFKQLLKEHAVQKVFTNRDYEPYAKERDEKIRKILEKEAVEFCDFKDQVIFEKDEITKQDGDPYVVYTPYKNTWISKFNNTDLEFHYTSRYTNNYIQNSRLPNLTLADIGFKKSSIEVPDYQVTPGLVKDYEKTRNFPAKEGTSRLGPHLRFGTVSVRQMVREANKQRNKTFLEELVWREFFMQILFHYPETVTDAFRKKYDSINWRNNKKEFEKWKKGETGYPIVDAGMRQLNQTGYMHNRIRMVVGSFLCKHLLIDWRWGEAYFAEKLLDYEMSSNVGNWQWVAGSGVDAAPYFRIFNPESQVEKFDKDKAYIKEWVKEYGTDDYPEPMVVHKEARERALETYKKAVSN
ncbi:cryptochrome/photolyase family protein [Christiangramia flava]|uniref:Deoxyribodipyrimidine photolyase n=1 Tax=Christiangramia flava JLT2011 TaxID=1229726 RepID=A0A1L7IAQ1_9FLAO|nr:deoxyribodipyrimidine photo-lyase [Christiangramia flava]APU70283.1 Deoxyribodipyrimidine photolyase [Christiangramia flava JLT2011]OSS39769.1 Deoxyribodipyrimidine photolyase [Christiangramia flava JLT2011]